MTTREGIELDYCPQCRGVWLDRGELDKIIERSAGPAQQGYGQQPHQQHEQPRQEYREERRRHDDDDDYRHDGDHHKKHKKEGFLGDLFDF